MNKWVTLGVFIGLVIGDLICAQMFDWSTQKLLADIINEFGVVVALLVCHKAWK